MYLRNFAQHEEHQQISEGWNYQGDIIAVIMGTKMVILIVVFGQKIKSS